MSNASQRCLVVGGGPAGSTLAMQLVARGVAVELIDHGRAHYSGPFETVLASNLAMFERTGLDELLRETAEPDRLRHGAIWGSDEVVWRQDDARGYLLRRGPFDAALRELAAARGVQVRCPARFDGSQRAAVRAFATGRARNVDGLPPLERVGAPTTAITVVGEPMERDRGTAVVEAVADGWLWMHAPLVGAASCAVVVDADWLREQSTGARVRELLHEARGPAGRLGDWRIAHATDATARWRRPTDGGADLLLGDAAATIDPLASQGVEKALAAAEHAACVLHAAQQRPEWRERLLALHHRWERSLQRAHLRTVAEFHRREVRFADAPFWRRRRGEEPAEPAPPQGSLQFDASVRAQPVLVRRGDGFAEVDGAVDERTGEQFAYVGRVPVPPLLRLLEQPCSLREAVARAGREPNLFVLSPRDVHDACLHLWRLGWLTSPDGAGSR